MGILQKAFSLFSRKDPIGSNANPENADSDQAAHKSTPEEPADNPDSGAASSPSSDAVIYIYSHGFTNGAFRVDPDKDSFERFLEYCNLLDNLKDRRALTERSISEVTARLDAATAALEADSNTLVEKEKLAENIALSLAEIEQRRKKKDEEEAALINQVKETVSEYAWVPAILYLLAGITFVVADISITQQITSWGFNMEGWQGDIFAIGLAFTAFLIKPAIDRLLEKPFQAAGFKLRTLYKCVLLGITVIGLVMLFFLGKFRSDSEIARRKLDDINNQSKEMDPNSVKYIELQRQREEVNDALNQNIMGQTGLILSGILFATGGAICLSISFGSLKQLINRHRILPARIRRIKKEISRFDDEIVTRRLEHTQVKIEQEKAATKITANETVLLKESLKKLQEERASLLTEVYRMQFEKERALYLDGKNKGEKYNIEGNLLYKVNGKEDSSLYLGNKNTHDESQQQMSSRPYTRRPFVKMRKMIADNFNNNQFNQSNDNTEFEIVS